MRFSIVVSQFNEDINTGLLNGAKSFLSENDVPVQDEDIFYAPGAFEIPLIAKKLAATQKYQGVICLGSVIKGDTAHFEFISAGATYGLMQATLDQEVPIAFGILTTYEREQALVRSRPDSHNKGIEAASACFESAKLLKQISH